MTEVKVYIDEAKMGMMVVCDPTISQDYVDATHVEVDLPVGNQGFYLVQCYDPRAEQNDLKTGLVWGVIKQNGRKVTIDFDTPQTGTAVLCLANKIVDVDNQSNVMIRHTYHRYVCAQTYVADGEWYKMIMVDYHNLSQMLCQVETDVSFTGKVLVL